MTASTVPPVTNLTPPGVSATLRRAVCEEGTAADAQVRELSQALMVAHAETVFRGVPRLPALRRTLAALETSWGRGAFGPGGSGGSGGSMVGVGGKAGRGGAGELPWVVLQDGT
jgi:hypothetical protein